MPFDMKDLGRASRFFWPGDPKGEEWVEIRALSDKEQRSLMRECGMEIKEAFQPNPYTEKIERLEYMPSELVKVDLFLDKVWDLTIAAWNLRTPDGEEIPCTLENKAKLMSGVEEFKSWIDSCVEQVKSARQAKREELEKNSSGSRKGSKRSLPANSAG
jgi:hypothetical protein